MTEEEIHSLCKQYGIENYTINGDMSIDVDGNVYLWNRQLEKLPLKFNKISGDFYCNNNKLTTLEGCPVEVGNDFSCSRNRLTSLQGGPVKVVGDFWCSYNKLTTLKNGPKFIGGGFYCAYNPIFEEFKAKFNEDYNLYLNYVHRKKVLKQLIND